MSEKINELKNQRMSTEETIRFLDEMHQYFQQSQTELTLKIEKLKQEIEEELRQKGK